MDSLDVAFVDDDRHQEHRKLRRLSSDNAVVFRRHQLLALFDSHQIRLAMERERNRRFTDLMRKEERKAKKKYFLYVISVGLFIGFKVVRSNVEQMCLAERSGSEEIS